MTASRPARDGTLLGLAVGISGLAFGAAAVSSGLSVWQTCVLSLLAYTGASQFALAGTIAAGGSCSPARPAPSSLVATFISLYLTWNATTLAGAVGAGSLGSPKSFGLDVIGPAAFLALIWPRLTSGRTERLVGAGGAAIAIAATPLLPPGAPVILAAAAALAGTLASRPAA